MEFEDYTEDLENLDETPEITELDEMLTALPDWDGEISGEAAEELDEQLKDALEKSADTRNWMEVELVDSYRHPEFETQLSFPVDPETGEAMHDDFGDWLQCSRNTAGAQRPDLFMEDEEGIHIREDKCYHDLTALTQDIRHQTEARRSAFGEDVDLTYVVAPNFTIAEAERLQNYCENKLDVDLEWQLK